MELQDRIDDITAKIGELLRDELAGIRETLVDELTSMLRGESSAPAARKAKAKKSRKSSAELVPGSKIQALEEALKAGPVSIDDITAMGYETKSSRHTAINVLRKRGLKIELNREFQTYHLV
jgi:hypothetical protein